MKNAFVVAVVLGLVASLCQAECIQLTNACQHGDSAMVETLLEQGEDPDCESPEGWTPLTEAAFGDHLDIARLLVESGASVDQIGGQGGTALQLASVMGHLGLVDYLVSVGADVDATTADGLTPLMLASNKGRVGVVRSLIRGGASVNARAGDGRTVLDIAAGNNQSEAVDVLLENGAADSTLSVCMGTLEHIAIVLKAEDFAVEFGLRGCPGDFTLSLERAWRFGLVTQEPTEATPLVSDTEVIDEGARVRIVTRAKSGQLLVAHVVDEEQSP